MSEAQKLHRKISILSNSEFGLLFGCWWSFYLTLSTARCEKFWSKRDGKTKNSAASFFDMFSKRDISCLSHSLSHPMYVHLNLFIQLFMWRWKNSLLAIATHFYAHSPNDDDAMQRNCILFIWNFDFFPALLFKNPLCSFLNLCFI